MTLSKVLAALLMAAGVLAGGLTVPAAAGAAAPAGAGQRVSAEAAVAQQLQAAGYRLRSVRVVRRIRTPRGYTFPVNATYPQMSGGKAAWRNRFNNAVLAGVKRMWRSQASSVDYYHGACKDLAAMAGGWAGGFVDGHYASILIDWNSGSCGGVGWDSQFASVTMSIRSGKLHSLSYMMAKLGGRASWEAAHTLVSWQAADCAEQWGSVAAYKPAGWRVDRQRLYLAFERYQIGCGACGSPTYQLSWASYRSLVA